jgi:hypothetical protein
MKKELLYIHSQKLTNETIKNAKSKQLRKQLKEQLQLKDNLQSVLDVFESFVDYTERDNYLMGISISRKKGNVIFHYGSDPVEDEAKMVKKLRKSKK